MVRAGELFDVGDIKIEIVEVIPYKDIRGRDHYLIGYRIIDGKFISPVGHFWFEQGEDIRKHLRNIAKTYKEVKSTLMRGLKL